MAPPGRLLLFPSPAAMPQVVADCLFTPTSMALDKKSGTLVVTEIFTGRVMRLKL